MADKTQQESEAYVKLYQLEPIVKSLEEVKQLIREQNGTYVPISSLALVVQELKGEIQTLKTENNDIKDTMGGWRKFAIALVLTVLTLIINTAWQYIMNNGRVQ